MLIPTLAESNEIGSVVPLNEVGVDRKPASSLLQAAGTGAAKLIACFGGQGPHNALAVERLRELSKLHGALVDPLLHVATHTLNGLTSNLPSTESDFHTKYGFDLGTWITHPDSTPDPHHLALAPISFPLNTIISLVQVRVTCVQLGIDPGQFADHLVGVTGHSQGLFAAAAIASSDDWPSFLRAFQDAISLSYFVGLVTNHAAPRPALDATALHDCLEQHEGNPSWMLSVSGMPQDQLMELVGLVNSRISRADERVSLALANLRDRFVLAGPPQSLYTLCHHLRTLKAPDGQEQTRVLHSKRKPVLDVQFLPISAPYHSKHLAGVVPTVERLFKSVASFNLKGKVPIIHTQDGSLMCQDNEVGGTTALRQLIRGVCVDVLDWPRVCGAFHDLQATHVLDFGPGNTAALTADLVAGTGVRVIHINHTMAGQSSNRETNSIGDIEELTSSVRAPRYASSWQHSFAPRVAIDDEGHCRLVTKMTATLGAPHIMVAGMTPTTVSGDFVAAIMRAGYHVELAGGGYHDETEFARAVLKLSDEVSQTCARGITCNLLYASPRSLAWQVSALTRLVQRDAIALDGITIGAGVPAPSVVTELIESMRLRHITFKPGSHAGIAQVLDIAERHADFPIGLQWTGGRAGGHHSWEDQHEPILKWYSRIRSYPNVFLIAGGGFGDGPSSLPYMTGGWAVPFGYPPMPFDGVMVGSRMMVATEAKTSPAAKKLIVDAPGVHTDDIWHQTWDQPAGGVLTVNSEMGEPIHVLATRAMLLWKELDRDIFSIRDAAQRGRRLQERRHDIISRLNRDYCRPWFPVDEQGVPVRGIGEMSYRTVLKRLCDLLFVEAQGRWIAPSYLDLVRDYLVLISERFGSQVLGHLNLETESPSVILSDFTTALQELGDQLLYPEDVTHLLALFRLKGRKPVPFIPVLDSEFETWFKKDSLWQSENVESVIGQDAQRVCIIQGPVAVRYSRSLGETARDILDGINQHHLDAYTTPPPRPLLDGPKVTASRMGLPEGRTETSILDGVHGATNRTSARYTITSIDIPLTPEILLAHVARAAGPWAETCLLREHLYQESHPRLRNPIRRAFMPHLGDEFLLDVPTAAGYRRVSLRRPGFTTAGQNCEHAVDLTLDEAASIVTLRFDLGYATLPADNSAPCSYRFSLKSHRGTTNLYQDERCRAVLVRHLYTHLWLSCAASSVEMNAIGSKFDGGQTTITQQALEDYMTCIWHESPKQTRLWRPSQDTVVPIDYCIVLAWPALTRPLLMPTLGSDLTELLHQSISFQYAHSARALCVGDTVEIDSQITSFTLTPSGRVVEVTADILRQGEPVLVIRSRFFVPGSQSKSQQFRSSREPDHIVRVSTPVVEALLLSRKWLVFDDPSPSILGKTLVFRLLQTRRVTEQDGETSFVQVTGIISSTSHDGRGDEAGMRTVGRVYFEHEKGGEIPVFDFLGRHGSPRVSHRELRNPLPVPKADALRFEAPRRGDRYAAVSGDHNPIHTHPVFARFAGQPGVVVHGMLTSAVVRRLLEWAVGDKDRTRFRSWSAQFVTPVHPVDALRAEVQHVAMEAGKKVFAVRVFKADSGDKVLEAEALVEQPRTAYLFCGQGSQEKGMGMSLYEKSPVAAALWDRGDRHLRDSYGFSILQIVRQNPRTVKVHFGGRRGRKMRDNYLALKQINQSDGGQPHDAQSNPLLGLTPDSDSLTFSYPGGLLFSTQFSQPALVLMEMAEYAHLQAQGVIQTEARFAGHSLGEYAALGACTGVFSLEDMLSLVFYRGVRMHHALPRNADGHTAYAMLAVNPSRVDKGFSETEFLSLVHLIAAETGLLLEVVNYNIPQQQYICAGHRRTLWILGQVCDRLASRTYHHPLDQDTAGTFICEGIERARKVPDDRIVLTQGKATMPLPGIDIPFHSTLLRGEIDTFRQYLDRYLSKADIRAHELVDRWIPNVVGRPFSLSPSFIEDVRDATGSPRLNRLAQLSKVHRG